MGLLLLDILRRRPNPLKKLLPARAAHQKKLLLIKPNLPRAALLLLLLPLVRNRNRKARLVRAAPRKKPLLTRRNPPKEALLLHPLLARNRTRVTSLPRKPR